MQSIQRPSGSGLLIARLCGLPALMLGLSLALDSVWFHDYSRLPLLGGMLIGLMVLATICQSLSQRTAHQNLSINGYDRMPWVKSPKK